MIDIDYFKNFNDALGHAVRDACLIQVAETIHQNASRAGELAARYGGEDFIVLLPSSKTANYVTISIGCATLDFGKQPLDLPEQLIQQADHALYQAKQKGRNRVEVYLSVKNGCED